MSEKKLISIKEFAEEHNTELNRRGHKMSESYIYRLIRQHLGRHKIKGKRSKATRELWFDYVLEGEKERILIEI